MRAKAIILAIVIFVALLIGMLIFAFLSRSESNPALVITDVGCNKANFAAYL